MLWRDPGDLCDAVLPDSVALGRIAARMCLQRGTKRLAVLSWAPWRRDLSATSFGFVHEATISGAQAADIQLPREKPFRTESDRAAFLCEALAALPSRPEAVLVVGTLDATLEALPKAGFVPGEGFTVVSPVRSASDGRRYARKPGMLCVNQRVPELGHVAADQLVWRIQHPEAEPQTVLIEPEPIGDM
jgi:DNA-binding LacI/PurR family transcriptional regulator